ncbi:PDC sensor domain-containing protein [Aquimarina agarilytica]|uniref:PDC sensor domain-containing protein n=1 Tax=Aquimarina agarilytica TaxID=1087449 RepID=UPI0004924D0A|nr:cache domain-containing protein [Aquimarina agarilytica]
MIRKILYAITFLITLLLAYLIFNFIKFSYKQDHLTLIKGTQTTTELKKNINNSLSEVMNEGVAFKQLLETREFSLEALESLIKERSFKLTTILGITVAYEAYSFTNTKKLYAPYYDKNQNKLIQIGELYDYTDPSLETSSWYVNVAQKGPHWIEPYYAKGAQALVSDYSIPFYYTNGPKKGQYRGVVTMTISLKGFTDMIHSISLGKTGFGFVTSEKGKLLAHPINEYVGLKNIYDLIKEEKNEALIKAYQGILDHKTGHVTYNDASKKQKALFFYDNVPISNWKIAVQFFKNDLLKNQELYKRKYINLSIVTSFLFLLLLANFYNRDHLSTSEIWYLSLFSTSILLANIFLIGYLQHTKANANVRNESPPITDKTALNNIVNAQLFKAKKLSKPPKKVVPTGIYIERLEFNDSYNVNISGTL